MPPEIHDFTRVWDILKVKYTGPVERTLTIVDGEAIITRDDTGEQVARIPYIGPWLEQQLRITGEVD